MNSLFLILRNSMRHPLRTGLTILGIAIAVMAFAVIRTSINAWYANAEAAAPNRLITRNAVSLVFPLPISYVEKAKKIAGVTAVSHSSWFGGVYVDPQNFFPKFAIDHENYLNLYPEFLVPADQLEAFRSERNAVIVGRKLADRFGWKIGDRVQIVGDIYPGDWDFVIRGIYAGRDANTDEATWVFRYDFLDERMKQDMPSRAGYIGTLVLQISNPDDAAKISEQVDALFINSSAETKTETEEAFTLSFISMSGQIITGLRIISFMVIGIILLVLANTMAMTARERLSEYAVLKTLGFRSYHIMTHIFGESMYIAILGGLLGIGLTFLVVPILGKALSNFLPTIVLAQTTLMYGMISALVVGLIAAIFPTAKALSTTIVDGLRRLE